MITQPKVSRNNAGVWGEVCVMDALHAAGNQRAESTRFIIFFSTGRVRVSQWWTFISLSPLWKRVYHAFFTPSHCRGHPVTSSAMERASIHWTVHLFVSMFYLPMGRPSIQTSVILTWFKCKDELLVWKQRNAFMSYMRWIPCMLWDYLKHLLVHYVYSWCTFLG